MDRLTGKDAQLMMEAVANVYEKKRDCVDKSKKTKHNCAKKVCSEQWGEGTCVPEHHTLLEDGTVTHYDVVFEHGLERMVPVEELEVLVTEMHEHAAMEGESLDENRNQRGAAARANRQAAAAAAAAQGNSGGPTSPSGGALSMQDRRFARRSSSAAARANTNRVGQNIKVGSPTGPAQNDQLKKPTGTAPAAPTSMANKAPANPNVTKDGTKFERRLPTMAELRAAQAARKAAAAAGKDKAGQESAAVKAGVGEGQRKPPTAPPPVSAGKSAATGAAAGAASKSAAGSPAAQAAAGAPNRKEDLFTGKPIPSAKPAPAGSAAGSAGAAAAPVVKKKPPMGARNRMRMEELDVFDTIKEYLIGEGATEEEALKQMLTLTDEQRIEILEGSCGSKKKKKSKKGGY